MFQRSRDRSYGEGDISDIIHHDRGKSERKDDTANRGRGNYTRGNSSAYPRNTNNGNRGDRSWLKGIYFKSGEGHRAFECTFFGKNIGKSSKNALIQEEAIDPPNEPKKGEYSMIRTMLWNEKLNNELVLRKILF